jgi:hypothetical protein
MCNNNNKLCFKIKKEGELIIIMKKKSIVIFIWEEKDEFKYNMNEIKKYIKRNHIYHRYSNFKLFQK